MGLSVRLPRQRVWPILPGVSNFLNCRRDFSGIHIDEAGSNSLLLVCPGLCLGCGDPRLRGQVGTSW